MKSLGLTKNRLIQMFLFGAMTEEMSATTDHFLDQPMPKKMLPALLRDVGGLCWNEWRARRA